MSSGIKMPSYEKLKTHQNCLKNEKIIKICPEIKEIIKICSKMKNYHSIYAYPGTKMPAHMPKSAFRRQNARLCTQTRAGRQNAHLCAQTHAGRQNARPCAKTRAKPPKCLPKSAPQLENNLADNLAKKAQRKIFPAKISKNIKSPRMTSLSAT